MKLNASPHCFNIYTKHLYVLISLGWADDRQLYILNFGQAINILNKCLETVEAWKLNTSKMK